MARCRYCSRSGWAVRTNGIGLCGSCRDDIQEEVAEKLEHVRQALAYVRHAKDPEVQLSLCDVAIESVERLLPYEERRLAEINPLPSSLLLMLQTKKDEAANQIVVAPSQMRQLQDGMVHLHEIDGWQAASATAPPSSSFPPDEAPPEIRWWAWDLPSEFDPGSADGEDRRQDRRAPVGCFAFLLPDGSRATLENLSAGGLFLRTDQLQPPGTPVELVVSAAFGPARASGVVRWLRTTAGEMGMGIEFTQLSVELLEYLENRLACAVPVAAPDRVPLAL